MTKELLSVRLKKSKAKKITWTESKRNFDVECYLILCEIFFEMDWVGTKLVKYTINLTK